MIDMLCPAILNYFGPFADPYAAPHFNFLSIMIDLLKKMTGVESLDRYLDYLAIRKKLTPEERELLDRYFEDS